MSKTIWQLQVFSIKIDFGDMVESDAFRFQNALAKTKELFQQVN